MLKKNISIVMFSLLLATSCEQSNQYNRTENNDTVSRTIQTNDGRTLDLNFDNQKDVVVINIDGEEEVLNRKKSASGYWYANEHYELRGKGNDFYLDKDGKRISAHSDDLEYIKSENNEGDVMNMTFNNTQGTVKVYLNDGEEINLKEEKAASGIWYSSDDYELRGKGDYYQLKKGEEVLYEN